MKKQRALLLIIAIVVILAAIWSYVLLVAPARESLDLTSPLGLFSLLTHRSEAPADKPAVAIIYAAGVITDGEGGDGLLQDSGVASETMRKAFRTAARDPNVKAVVIRIDSPGKPTTRLT